MDVGRLLALGSEYGFHLFPVGANKRPFLRWRHGPKDYVSHQPTEDEIRSWFDDARTLGWAVLGGGIGRVLCLDVEAAGVQVPAIADVLGSLPQSCRRPTPGGGVHCWLQPAEVCDPELIRVQKLAYRADGLDEQGRLRMTLLAELRGVGGYAVLVGPGRPPLDPYFAPHEVTADELQALLDAVRAADERPCAPERKKAGAGRRQQRERPHVGQRPRTGLPTTPDVMADALVNGELSWTQVLDPGWEEVGVDGRGAVLLRRPEYGHPTEADHSANALGTCLVVHSASVPWAEPGIGYSPAQAMAAAWFDNDFARAMRSVESFARWRSVHGRVGT